MNAELYVSVGSGRNSKNWKTKSVDWEWFLDRCSDPVVTYETYKEYMNMDRDKQDEIKDVGGFVAGYINGRRRKKDAVVSRSALTLDADFAEPDFWKQFRKKFKCAALLYTTHKHSPEKPRFRLVIPTDRDMSVDEFEPVSRWVTGVLGIDQFDRTTYAVERLMYFPSHSKDGEFVFKEQDGDFLCVDDILGEYRDWRNPGEWTFGETEIQQVRTGMKKAGHPHEKPGVIGAFNRRYTIQEVIDEYLQDIYELAVGLSSEGDNRYTYVDGSTEGGLVVYDDMFTYSHHGTDPTSGILCNAFDLVRIHKFGYLDVSAKEGTPINRMPSFTAMSELATQDKEVVALIGEEKMAKAYEHFDVIPEPEPEPDFEPRKKKGNRVEGRDLDDGEYDSIEPEEPKKKRRGGDTKWLADMECDKRGVYLAKHKNYELVIDNDPGLHKRIAYNQFSQKTEVIGGLPWGDQENRAFDEDDEALLYLYLGKPPYELKRSPMMMDALVAVKKKNAFHPVKDYLNGLVWDGVKRLDTAMIDFLAAEDTPYTRAVTRKWFLAGCYRIFTPGCKFDEVLVAVGPERMGKSVFFGKLAGRKWFTDQFKFHMLGGSGNGKQAFEVTQGKWIIEVAEMAGLNRTESTDAKAFLSAQIDTFRPSHKPDTIDRPRSFILAGTSNDYGFLQGALGNGRFWPVDVFLSDPEYDLFTDLDQDYVDQLWAETMVAMRAKEPLTLSKEMKAEAKKQQIAHEETTGTEGLLLDYLNMEVPQDWAEMSVDARHIYFKGKHKSTGFYIDKVCAVQIWCEVYGEKMNKINRFESMKINTMMRKMTDWFDPGKSLKFRFYGSQKGFKRR